MKIIITGALGHIGSKLIRAIPQWASRPQILMVDNMSTQRFASLFNLPAEAKYEFFDKDLLDDQLCLHDLIRKADVVIHLAAITDAANSFNQQDKVRSNNIQSTKLIAEICTELNVPLIYPSTTSVYGTQAKQVDENCTVNELQPQSPYAESKLEEEQLIQTLSKQGLKFVICRLGTIYGISPGMRFHTAVNKFCWQAVLGESLTVWKTAYLQKRPYLSVEDAIDAFKFIIEQKLYDGEIYNIVSANHTPKDVITYIQKFIPNLRVEFVNSKIMNQLSYEVLNEKIKTKGFVCKRQLEDGIKETIELLKQVQAA